jgi:hypothetical protein
VTLDDAGVVMTAITAVTVITKDSPLGQKWNRAGRKVDPAPKKLSPNVPHSSEGKSQWAKSIGMKWNETAFCKVCKLLKTWWPGIRFLAEQSRRTGSVPFPRGGGGNRLFQR